MGYIYNAMVWSVHISSGGSLTWIICLVAEQVQEYTVLPTPNMITSLLSVVHTRTFKPKENRGLFSIKIVRPNYNVPADEFCENRKVQYSTFHV